MSTPPKITRDSSALTSEENSGTNTMNSEPEDRAEDGGGAADDQGGQELDRPADRVLRGVTRSSTAVFMTKSEPPRPAIMALMPKVTTL